MKRLVKKSLAPLARYITRRHARIIMYHRFGSGFDGRKLSTDELERQLLFLSRHFTIVPLSQIAMCIREARPFQPLSVALTVDDAYADFGELAYPLFRQYKIPVTVYVISEFSSGKIWLWWDAVRYILTNASDGIYPMEEKYMCGDIVLTDTDSRECAIERFHEHGLGLSAGVRDRFLGELQAAFSVPLPDSPIREFSAMTWEKLRKLDPDIVEIGAHTCTHPILSRCDDATIASELTDSKRDIEKQLGRQVTSFCYPNGQADDVDDRCLTAARKAGFHNAVMACGNLLNSHTDLFALDRLSTRPSLDEFICDISGLAYVMKRFEKTICKNLLNK